jgi:hypothetical protein
VRTLPLFAPHRREPFIHAHAPPHTHTHTHHRTRTRTRHREDWIEMIELGRLHQTADPAAGAGSSASGLSTSPSSNPFALPINWDSVKLVVKGLCAPPSASPTVFSLLLTTLRRTRTTAHASPHAPHTPHTHDTTRHRRVGQRTGNAGSRDVSAFGRQAAGHHAAARLIHFHGVRALAGRFRIVRAPLPLSPSTMLIPSLPRACVWLTCAHSPPQL